MLTTQDFVCVRCGQTHPTAMLARDQPDRGGISCLVEELTEYFETEYPSPDVMTLYCACYGRPYMASLFTFLPTSQFFRGDCNTHELGGYFEAQIVANVWVGMPWAHLEAARRGIDFTLPPVDLRRLKPVKVPLTILAEEEATRRIHLNALFASLRPYARIALNNVQEGQAAVPKMLREQVFIHHARRKKNGEIQVNGITVQPEWAAHAIDEVRFMYSSVLSEPGVNKYRLELMKLLCYHPASDVAVLLNEKDCSGEGAVVKFETRQVLARVQVRRPRRSWGFFNHGIEEFKQGISPFDPEWFAVDKTACGDVA